VLGGLVVGVGVVHSIISRALASATIEWEQIDRKS
jgi:hypothetical protein